MPADRELKREAGSGKQEAGSRKHQLTIMSGNEECER